MSNKIIKLVPSDKPYNGNATPKVIFNAIKEAKKVEITNFKYQLIQKEDGSNWIIGEIKEGSLYFEVELKEDEDEDNMTIKALWKEMKQEFALVHKRLDSLESDMVEVKEDIKVLKVDVKALREDVDLIKECPTVKKEIDVLKNNKKNGDSQ